MKKEIMFGGLISGHRVVVVNDLTLLIPSQQIEAVMRREISLAPNAPLSRMPGYEQPFVLHAFSWRGDLSSQ